MAQQPFLDRPTFNRHSSPGSDQVKRAGCRLAAVCEDLGDVALSEEYQDISLGKFSTTLYSNCNCTSGAFVIGVMPWWG